MELYKKNPYTRQEAEQAERGTKETWTWDVDSERILEAKAKLNAMIRAGHTEAIDLNNRHEELINKVKLASEELFQFEKDKLEMHKNKDANQSSL